MGNTTEDVSVVSKRFVGGSRPNFLFIFWPHKSRPAFYRLYEGLAAAMSRNRKGHSHF